ncbi:hypothetical protein SMKI_02G1230 [Saccharomyces mikatae IFO 1815]|uniref:Glutaredoxin domain-containing protein n=1 Tax=Saccharomyces mikatae IFO 1815 TaxID=226126 RepID=A0AA35IUN3_SACMI|nr:uncharacterized protein SMKI_02G1230 [Saccharomyces mikatae IFO 1815]CAI4037255.1 hypothetical protein SMKI_02G1230 [Saccharomyces mikatae IFO 1815]
MAIVINKRNVRVLVITNLLLILVFLVVRNSNANVNESTITPHGTSLATYNDAGNAPGTHKSVHDSDANKQVKEPDETNENSEEAQFDAAAEYDKILKKSPMIVFSKSFCPFSKKLKTLLAESYTFSPSYYVVELDKREHTSELQEHIEKSTGRRTVPNVVIDGISRGGCDEITALHENDKLLNSFKEWSSGKFTVEAISPSQSD